MIKDKLLYKEESYLIRGACFEVYNQFGGGIVEIAVIASASEAIPSQATINGIATSSLSLLLAMTRKKRITTPTYARL